ncbi:hypothetical protein [Marinicrinis sediminis]|uniref:Butirosin biosynthesis protein H N-terminal domain-containing protein n=1 Tax=Marinicrinis sediminis TaxID=1652465 RepID=A0ABW5RE26_9BACL
MIRKTLPIHANPGLETECYHNFRLSLLLADAQREPWAWGHFVNLQLSCEASFRFPLVRFEEHLDLYAPVLKEEPLPCEGRDCIAVIREAIMRDQYVVIYLNWKHIPGSNLYEQKDMVHDAIIYGFDDERKLLQMIAFEVEGRSYAPIHLSYELCRREFETILQEELHAQQWFAYYGFPLSAITVQNHRDMNFEASSLYFSLDRGKVGIQKGSVQMFANGYPVNEAMSDYFAQVAAGRELDPREYHFWNIVIVKMVQHKKWMLRRLHYLQANNPSKLLQACQRLYEKAKQQLMQVRIDSFKYQKTGEIHYVRQLSEHFHLIYEQEKRAVPLLMEHLIQVRMSPWQTETNRTGEKGR